MFCRKPSSESHESTNSHPSDSGCYSISLFDKADCVRPLEWFPVADYEKDSVDSQHRNEGLIAYDPSGAETIGLRDVNVRTNLKVRFSPSMTISLKMVSPSAPAGMTIVPGCAEDSESYKKYAAIENAALIVHFYRTHFPSTIPENRSEVVENEKTYQIKLHFPNYSGYYFFRTFEGPLEAEQAQYELKIGSVYPGSMFKDTLCITDLNVF